VRSAEQHVLNHPRLRPLRVDLDHAQEVAADVRRPMQVLDDRVPGLDESERLCFLEFPPDGGGLIRWPANECGVEDGIAPVVHRRHSEDWRRPGPRPAAGELNKWTLLPQLAIEKALQDDLRLDWPRYRYSESGRPPDRRTLKVARDRSLAFVDTEI